MGTPKSRPHLRGSAGALAQIILPTLKWKPNGVLSCAHSVVACRYCEQTDVHSPQVHTSPNSCREWCLS